MKPDYISECVVEWEAQGERIFFHLFREEILSLLSGNSTDDQDFNSFISDNRYRSQENNLNFFCDYKGRMVSIRRIIGFYGSRSPLVKHPSAETYNYTRTYDAANILIKLGITVYVNEEKPSFKKFFAKHKESPYLVVKRQT